MIEGLVIGLIAGFGAGVTVGIAFAHNLCDRVIRQVEGERDRALAEAKAFRNLVVPALGRAERLQGLMQTPIETPKPPIALPTEGTGAGISIPQAKAQTKPAAQTAAAAPVVPIGRMPFRRRFNFLRRQTNKKQIRTDTLATALASQKVPAQEKKQ